MEPVFSVRRAAQTLAGLGSLSAAAFLADRGYPDDQWLVAAGGLGGFALMAHAACSSLASRPKKRAASSDLLDRVLLQWTQDDPFTVRDMLSGGVAIFGRTGSGKTSSSGKAIANALVRLPGSGGLILAAKPMEDRAMWERIFAAAGRSQDLLVLGPNEPLRFNFIDYEMQQGGHTRNITKCISVIGEVLQSGDRKDGDEGAFWAKQQERMIYNAVEVVKLATGRVSAPDLQRFIARAAIDTQQFASDEWLSGFHNQCLKAAWEAEKSPVEQHDYQLAEEYWLNEYVHMADRTRSSILTGVMAVLHTYNTGLVRELVSSETNVTPDDMFAGRWILLDMPPSEWSDIGLFIAGGLKYLCQKAILRRVADASSNIVTVWADEAQQFVNSHDSHYIAQCRSHRGSLCYLTQSLHAYYAALKGEAGRHQADSLLTNFQTKIFHALADLETANYASGLVGRSLQSFTGGSMQPPESAYGELMGQSRFTGSFNQHFESTLQPNAFMHGLKTGGASNGYICNAYVIRSGEPFSTGENWIGASFDQRSPG